MFHEERQRKDHAVGYRQQITRVSWLFLPAFDFWSLVQRPINHTSCMYVKQILLEQLNIRKLVIYEN